MRDERSSASAFRLDANGFWGRYAELVRSTVIPYQWEALNDRVAGAEPSGAIRNFRIAAGLERGEYVGMVFQDSDVGKWIEAAAYSLATYPDAELEQRVDEIVEILERAQAPDGYLNTYFTLKEPGRRFSNLWECHELYCAGHLLEGAIAYYQATGKRRFLDVMLRYVELIERTFGPEPGQIRGYDGHEEIELALLRLFDVTGDERHLALARFFVEERGREPYFFHAEWQALGRRSHWTRGEVPVPDMAYFQSHLPVREQTDAVGHAVRAVYLYTALAELARRTADSELARAVEVLWRSVTRRNLYVTGAIGSTHQGEAFTFDYDLPNETAYAETCAAIGLVFFAERMLALRPASEFADVMELALYNAVLAGMSQDGRRFFYVNPLEVWPEASLKNPDRKHVRHERKPWFGCACCPPNLARLLLSLGRYVCHADGRTLLLHQYVSGTVPFPETAGRAELVVESGFPYDGRVRLVVRGDAPSESRLALRIPGWCRSFGLKSAGRPLERVPDSDGYLRVHGPFADGHELELDLDIEVEALEAHPRIRAAAGKLCLRRGPLVYCLEAADNGENLSALTLDGASAFQTREAPELHAGALKVVAKGFRRQEQGSDAPPYTLKSDAPGRSVELVAVPYYLWGNRGPGEMLVWLRRR